MTRTAFPCNCIAASFEEFRAWLQEYEALQRLDPHERLLRRVEAALSGGGPVIVSAPIDLCVMRRRDAGISSLA